MSEAETDPTASTERDGSSSAGDGGDATGTGPASDDERGASTTRSRREIAVRILAVEYDQATLSYAESDEERAPTYVVTPTGARANRVFVVGVLTHVEQVSGEVVRARIADPTGTFVVYAGQYQPDARGTFEETEPPEFVALTGKARTFSPEEANQVYASVRPESVAVVDAETRDRWAVRTIERTIERIDTMADVLAAENGPSDVGPHPDLPPGLAAGIPRARDHYGTTAAYLKSLRTCAREVAELVAGDRDAVDPPDLKPDEGGGSFANLTGDRSLLDRSAANSTAAEAAGDSGDAVTTAETGGGVTAGGSESSGDTQADGRDAEPDREFTATDDGSASAEREAGSPGTGAHDGDVDQPAREDSQSDVDGSSTTDPRGDGDDSAEDSVGSAGTAGAGGSPAASERQSRAEADASEPRDGSIEDALDPAEREEVEAEFGAEFESGTEVDGPGEAGIETPEPDQDTGTGDASFSADEDGATDAAKATPEKIDRKQRSDDPAGSEVGSEDAEGDFTDAVMDVMRELDDGDGADRTTVIERTAATTEADESVIEDAVTAALMDGRCYEPDDTTLKPI